MYILAYLIGTDFKRLMFSERVENNEFPVLRNQLLSDNIMMLYRAKNSNALFINVS